jgi:hypothetical protein
MQVTGLALETRVVNNVVPKKSGFRASFDRSKFGKLLTDQGYSAREVPLTVEIAGQPPSGTFDRAFEIQGAFDNNDNKITVYAHKFWEKYEELQRRAHDIAHYGETGNEWELFALNLGGANLFRGYLPSERLVTYLKTAPKERALAFADKILLKALNRNFNSTLLHETKHALDFQSDENLSNQTAYHNKGTKIAMVAGLTIGPISGMIAGDPKVTFFTSLGLGLTTILYHYIYGLKASPLEKLAYEFEKTHKYNSDYQGIISFQPA